MLIPRFVALLCLLVAAPAGAAPKHAAADPAALIAYTHRTADRVTPLPGLARPYAEAKRKMARGEPSEALSALGKSTGGVLADRYALLRADAFLALGKTKEAEAAYRSAIEQARVESVALLAARGLVDVYGQLGKREQQLAYVDALLTVRRIARRANLLTKRATLLMELGRHEEAAEQAWRIVLDYPTAHPARAAQVILTKLEKRGVKMPSSSVQLELARIRNLIRSRAFARAEKAIDALEKANPKLSRALAMKRAELYRGQRKRTEERQALEKLRADGLTDDDGPAILMRLGQLAMSADEDDEAIRIFDALVAKYPSARERDKAQYLAAWLPYNEGHNAKATARMLAFTAENPKSAKRTEALWWAGWSAYLGDDFEASRAAFAQLIAEHPTSDLVPHARYWIGRIHQRADQPELARAAYRAVLEAAPLSYYGFWASARLEELGETTVLAPPPPTPPPATLREVLARLGANRPTNVDRAVLLFGAGLEEDTLEELEEAGRFLRKVRDTEGRTMVADMLVQLGAHYMAFRTGARIAADGAELETGAPWAWRAWRHAYPEAFDEYVERAAKTHEVDPHLVFSIMRTESHYRPYVRSRVGARGLMQIMPRTARAIGRRAEGGRRHAARFKNPDSNIWLGTWYLDQLLERFGGQLPAAIGAYNAGPSAMSKWLDEFGGRSMDEFVERIPYKETRRYVRRVLETMMVYRRLYGGDLPKLITEVKAVAPEEDAVRF